jgi:CRISPR-associated protein Cmr3
MKFLVNLKPLDYYFFGGERTFSFIEEGSGRPGNAYFISSEDIPPQTAVLGLIRKQLLIDRGCFKDSFSYNSEEKNNHAELIGNKSFSLTQKNQTFGVIKNISEVIITDKSGGVYIPLPFDHCNTEKGNTYLPVEFEKKPVSAYLGGELASINLPSYFNPKDGVREAFVNCSTGVIHEKEDFIRSRVQLGIKKTLGAKAERGFFKRRYKTLKEGLCFAFYLELDGIFNVPEAVVYLGQSKSPFLMKIMEAPETKPDYGIFSTESAPKEKLKYVCVSDAYANKSIYDYCSFAFVKTKTFRNLSVNTENVYTAKTSNDSKTPYYGRMKQSAKYNLIRAGSVFYVKDTNEFERIFNNEDCQRIGLNKFIKCRG